jgi:hypothetical protein
LILRIATIALVFVGYANYPQRTPTQPVPQFVYGQWTITKFVEVGGHLEESKVRAEEQLGKTLRIAAQSFSHDSKFLWFENTCKNPTYRMKKTDGDQGSLGFYSLKQEEGGQFLIVSCNQRDSYFLEIAQNQELATYYDGWFFFLRKTKGTSES